MENTIKELYSGARKDNKALPEFDKLDSEFDISSIEDSIKLKSIRTKICEKVDFYAKLIEELLQPEANLIGMYECKVFREDEKEEIYNTLKSLMFMLRHAAEVELKSDDKEEMVFIVDTHKDWIALKPELLKIVSKIKSSWEKETELKDDLEYFG
jgi:hypothetical protein